MTHQTQIKNKDMVVLHPLREKVSENLFASFIIPVMIELSIIISITIFPTT